jgi:hypothetical protein
LVRFLPGSEGSTLSRLSSGRSRLPAPAIHVGEKDWLGNLFGDPVAESEVFADFSTFVAILLGLGGPVIHLSEGMFGAAKGFIDHVERL